MATFLFVHGAFQGGWVWKKAATLLRKNGHEVYTPTLSGCGYLAGAVRDGDDLTTYIRDLENFFTIEDPGEVILVGHSFSGMICGALMMRLPHIIRQAVFVDAVIPDADRSFAETAGELFRQMVEKHRLPDGSVRPWPLPVFGVAKPHAQWFGSRLRPFPARAFFTPFPGAFDPAAIPAAFIGCRETVSPFIREMTEKAKQYGWPIRELQAGHCPMVTCPADLVDAILTLVPPA